MPANQKILIIGGNAAGPGAAAKAKRVAPDAEVIMFEAGEFISTGTCELPYVLSGEIDDYKKIVFFDSDSFYKEKKVKVYTKHIVEYIDRRQKKISVKNLNNGSKSEFPYDKLVLATGSKAVTIPDLPPNLQNVFYLKTVSDLIKIQSYIKSKPVEKILIVGAGYIGLETADALVRMGKKVAILDKAKLPMPNAELEISHLILETLKGHKVDFYGGVDKVKYNITGEEVKSVSFNGMLMEFDLVLGAIGFKPNNSLAVSAMLNTGKSGGIIVDKKLRTSDPDIFAAGDNIEVINKITGKHEYLPLATIAHEYGHIAGANAAGANEFAGQVIKNIAVKIFDYSLVNVGLTLEESTRYGIKAESVYSVIPNLIKVMPESRNDFGKIVYNKTTGELLGASFYGSSEAVGLGNVVSVMIHSKIKAAELAEFNYNYTPPLSPFVNILSVLGRKIKSEH